MCYVHGMKLDFPEHFGIAPRHRRTLHPAAVAWFGNAAKMRVIDRILAMPGPLTVLDYGAGTGQGWAEVLAARPDIRLLCVEPCAKRRAALRALVPAAEVVTDAAQVDVIVSFSVLEHVFDRRAYMANARRWLKPGGAMFLNYDDGHFRTPGSWLEAARNRLAPLLPALGMVRHYQRPVSHAEAQRLIDGFAIRIDRYENLPNLKALAKTATDRAAFACLWIEAEDRLNANLPSIELWRAMGSRTLELVAH